jgi:hypothetical protein
MNDISASIGRGNLLHLDRLMAHQKLLGDIYRSYGLFAHTWLAGGFTENYTGLQHILKDFAYEMGQHHYRNDKYTVFGGKRVMPVMNELEFKYFFVPYHYGVSESDAHQIGRIIQAYEKR